MFGQNHAVQTLFGQNYAVHGMMLGLVLWGTGTFDRNTSLMIGGAATMYMMVMGHRLPFGR